MMLTAVGGLSARGWRRLERSARASFADETLSAARRLSDADDLIVEASHPGVVRLRGGERQAALAGVVAPASLQGVRCRLVSAGRYGRWWWFRLSVAEREVTLLGSHLRVAPVWGGGRCEGPIDSPAGGEPILVPCEYGSPSATSPG